MTAINIFIDTNILLNFYSFSDDRLEILDELIELAAPDKITIHLPKQVENELKRNRESKLQIAMSDFKKSQISTGIPHHMQGTEAAKQYDDAVKSAEQAKRLLIANAISLALRNELEVDQKISRLFERSSRHTEDDELYQKALIRMNKGNPPGKPQNIGDRYIWETLLAYVPDGDIFIISKDGDYTSPLTMDKVSRPLAYLSDEWAERKQGRLTIFRTINEILEYYKNLQNQPDINNPVVVGQEPLDAEEIAEPTIVQIPNAPVAEVENTAPQPIPEVLRDQIERAILTLTESGNFATTHQAVADIKDYLAHLTKDDAERLFQAALDNSQIRWIISDEDVNHFYLSLINKHVTEVDPEIANNIIELLGLLSKKP